MINLHRRTEGSWGVVGRCFTDALRRRVPVALLQAPAGDAGPRPSPDAVTLNFAEWQHARKLPGRRVITYLPWETSRIPRRMLSGLKRLDHLWVPSVWQRGVFIANGLSPDRIDVVPLGFDPAVFHPGPVAREEGVPFRFLFVGKWEERKSPARLIEAFAREFSPSEPVELVMHAHNPFVRVSPEKNLRAVLDNTGTPDARIRCVGTLPEGGLAEAYRRADAFVLPTRSEGWGLPILEAMASGLPCIVTGYSGLTEFAHAGNARLISSRGLVPVRDLTFFPRVPYFQEWGVWADPDPDHLRQLMRATFEDLAGSRALGRAAAAEALGKWTWDHAAAVALEKVAAV